MERFTVGQTVTIYISNAALAYKLEVHLLQAVLITLGLVWTNASKIRPESVEGLF